MQTDQELYVTGMLQKDGVPGTTIGENIFRYGRIYTIMILHKEVIDKRS
ncbi:hypothetical protein [Thalassobacillus sp. C254]|nr:hypothetical protein [Thalassobacillus sp. C254]